MYREEVANAVFLVSGATELAGASNLLPDINTRGLVFNAGTYQRMGASAAVTQTVTDHFEIVVSGGTAGALVAAAGDPAQKLDPLRSQIQSAQRYWATVRADASMPVTGTHLAASYGWTDFNALMPTHLSLTGRTTQQLGWNFSCRQPLPGFGGTRMELSAELRNMLAQGYLLLSDGPRHAQLTNSPRALRGGLSFNF